MSDRVVYKLNDEFIGQIAKVVQLAILTGTNVVDHMRQMRVEPSLEAASTLVLTPEYTKYFDDNIKKLLDEAARIMAEDEAAKTEKAS